VEEAAPLEAEVPVEAGKKLLFTKALFARPLEGALSYVPAEIQLRSAPVQHWRAGVGPSPPLPVATERYRWKVAPFSSYPDPDIIWGGQYLQPPGPDPS
jgi:hypothetical protein